MCAAASGAACGGDSPAAPTPLAATPGAPSAISGIVTDVISGSGLPGVVIAVERIGSATTDGSGAFVLESGERDGDLPITLSGGGVVTRRTTVALRPQPITMTLIPSGFDMAAFEEFARSWTSGAIVRWTERPALIVEIALVGTPGAQNVASAGRIADGEADRVIEHLSRALPTLTGSTFPAFASVAQRTTPIGQPVGMYTPGAITVVYYTDDDDACGRGGPLVSQAAYRIVAGAIWLKLGCASPTTLVHELGHALGYGHVTSTSSVMSPSGRVSVTAFDRAAATIAFRRPPGNRAPDTDPDTFRVNTSTRSAGGRLVILPPLP